MGTHSAQSARPLRIAAFAAIGACALALSGCVTVNVPPKTDPGGSGSSNGSGSTSGSESASGSESPGATQQHGDSDFPAAGIPADVAWPSEWLAGFDSEGVRGDIVSIDLDYENGTWIWEVTSRDPGTDNAHPKRGFEADLAADTLAVLSSREVSLDEDELATVKIGIAEAAKISEEKSPSPRLTELSLDEHRGAPVWEASLVDTKTWAETDLKIDANTGEVLSREAD